MAKPGDSLKPKFSASVTADANQQHDSQPTSKLNVVDFDTAQAISSTRVHADDNAADLDAANEHRQERSERTKKGTEQEALDAAQGEEEAFGNQAGSKTQQHHSRSGLEVEMEEI